MTKRGKLIVIDGIDGSGKATQVKLLAEKLRQLKIRVKTIDFPRYYDNFFGRLIGEYLSGAYGDFIKTDPRVASVLYAADRFESSQQIRKWLADDLIVIADRYVSANQIHQGGKISDKKERRNFMQWLEAMEYGIFQIPKPDLVIFLDVPYEVSRAWLQKKITQRQKKYLAGRKDVAEDNLLHLKNSRQCALNLAKQNKNWARLECCRGQICLLPDEVNQKVFTIIKKRLGL
ncbi:MAG: deoxynucleoside kinase [Candidatus Vogelbacteria bacterium]|nr:deoxynucleoside kinase [Candidatus Vogelbacteria bacterium]